MLKKVVLGVALSALSVSLFAGHGMRTSKIDGFKAMISQLQSQNTSKVSVVFPMGVPKPDHGVTYYPNFDVNSTGYNIYLDSSANCKGAHYCNLVSLNANKATKVLSTYKNQKGQKLTKTVTLKNGETANYTPGFAMGDYWNPQISWQNDGATYTLSWVGIKNTDRTQMAMIKMANHLNTFTASQASGS